MSDMDKVWIFACAIVVVIKPYLLVEVRQDESLTWSKASEKCGNEGLEFNESILKGFDILQGKTFWIGKAVYSRTSDWIEMLGCYEVKPPTGMTELAEISSVGKCQIKCKSFMLKSPSYFGYNKETCICICAGNKPSAQIRIQDCESTNFSNAYLFYQEYQGDVSAGHGRHCTSLKCLSGKNNLIGVDCSSTYVAGRCENEGTNKALWGITYSNIVKICKSNNQLLLAPSTYCSQNGHANLGISLWTNVFRKDFEDQLTKAEAGQKSPLKCLSGQLKKIDGILKLITTERSCSNTLNWFVCRNAEFQSTVASSTVNIPPNSRITYQKPFITIASTERISYAMNSTVSPGVNKNVEQNNHQIDNSEERSNSKAIGAVIGGLLGACSVIALLAVLIVCKVRSIGVFRESSKQDKQETGQMEFSKSTYQDSYNTKDKRSTTPTSNETYGLAEKSTAVYAVVNKLKTPGNINDIYNDTGYGEYDHLHDIQNRRISPQENMYHSHGAPRNEEEQTYDSSDFGKGKAYDGNGVYDQSFSVVEGEDSYMTNQNHDNSNSIGIYDKAS